ncbi:MAG TPA: calcium/proton exchanger [Acetobacteraceae bacterium]
MTGGAATEGKQGGQGLAAALASLKLPLGLLLLVPVAPVLKHLLGASPTWVFLAGALAVAVLADWVRRSTEHVAEHVGSAIGGLMTISFGSLAEVILAVFVLAEGKVEVVRAQITGSIIGTSLFGLGLAIVVGGIGRERQHFKRERAGQLSSMLILVVIALLLPAAFDLAERSVAGPARLAVTDEQLSIGVSVILLVLYGANLLYTLVTHRDVFASEEPQESGAAWPLWAAIGVLVAATAAIAFEAELVSGALEATAASLGLTQTFVGIIVLALVGTASDLFAAAWFARQDKIGLAFNICAGSAIQVALVVAPVLVLVSWALGKPMTLVFDNPLDLFGIAGAAFIVNAIASDGETTWFEGVLLVGVYVLLGTAFFFIG